MSARDIRTYAVLGIHRIHLEEIITTAAVSTVEVFTLVHTITNRDALVYILKLGNKLYVIINDMTAHFREEGVAVVFTTSKPFIPCHNFSRCWEREKQSHQRAKKYRNRVLILLSFPYSFSQRRISNRCQ